MKRFVERALVAVFIALLVSPVVAFGVIVIHFVVKYW